MDLSQTFTDFWAEMTATGVTTSSAIFKLVVSMLLGCAVGIERKRKGQTAGIRTFALICMGATLAMLISIYVPQEYLGLKNGDPGRIAAQVISGIGFLGAGAIIQMKGSVRGLTTAAGIWMIATIGLTVGLGMYLLAFAGTLLMVFVLHLVERLERKIHVGSAARIIHIRINGIVTDIEDYKKELKRFKVNVSSVYVNYDYTEKITSIDMLVLAKENVDYMKLFDDLSRVNDTQSISLASQINI